VDARHAGDRGSPGRGKHQHRSRHRPRSGAPSSRRLALTRCLSGWPGAGSFFSSGASCTVQAGRVGMCGRPRWSRRGVALPSSRTHADKCLAFSTTGCTPNLRRPRGVVRRRSSATFFPTGGFYYSHPMIHRGEGGSALRKETGVATMNTVTPGFFHRLASGCSRGRDFADSDRPGLDGGHCERDAWQEASAESGPMRPEDLRSRLGTARRMARGGRRRERDRDFQAEVNTGRAMQYYRPIRQVGGNYFSIAAPHDARLPEAIKTLLSKAVFRVDPDQAIYELTTADQAFEDYNRATTRLPRPRVLGCRGSCSRPWVCTGSSATWSSSGRPRSASGSQWGRSFTQVVLGGDGGKAPRLAAVGIPIGLFGAWGLVRILASTFLGAPRRTR